MFRASFLYELDQIGKSSNLHYSIYKIIIIKFYSSIKNIDDLNKVILGWSTAASFNKFYGKM